LKRQAEEKRRKEEEEKKRKEAELKRQQEEARREAERRLAEQRRREEEARRIAFENDKAALLAQFQMPPADRVPVPVAPALPADAQETVAAREFHGIVALMRGQNLASLPPEQRILLADALATRRNRAWRAAVTDPHTTEAERPHLRLPLPVDEGGFAHHSKMRLPPYRPPASAPVAETGWPEAMRDMLLSDLMIAGGEELALNRAKKIANNAIRQGAGESIENVVSVAKVALAAHESTSQGVAAGVDLLIGALEMPQASWAVTGGRIYSATAFGAMNDFMTKAMAATGKPFDSEEFWRAFKESLTEGQRSVCDWIEYVPDKD
jgi:hypothetical protein